MAKQGRRRRDNRDRDNCSRVCSDEEEKSIRGYNQYESWESREDINYDRHHIIVVCNSIEEFVESNEEEKSVCVRGE